MADPKPQSEKAKAAATEISKILSGSGKAQFPNPPDPTNPDPATLKEQWRYAIRQYSRMYSHAWGTAILAGASFFALGWFIKGGNPLPSFVSHNDKARQVPRLLGKESCSGCKMRVTLETDHLPVWKDKRQGLSIDVDLNPDEVLYVSALVMRV